MVFFIISITYTRLFQDDMYGPHYINNIMVFISVIVYSVCLLNISMVNNLIKRNQILFVTVNIQFFSNTSSNNIVMIKQMQFGFYSMLKKIKKNTDH